MEKYTYEVNEKYQVVQRSDGATIPMDESNRDYQTYLAWLENPETEQSTPIDTEDE
jgi:hypothetical protein